ncbi:major facilitator superfamily domain-containing protein [Xylariales sp. AK1849]|nr:major facilitator superfamily domain-containing protein [Xylariales sp. AK1849]
MSEKEDATPAPIASDADSAAQPENPGASAPAATPEQAPAVPDGGRKAWLVVFGSMVALVHTWGIVNSFGVFQTYYETELLSTRSSSDISWIGSVQGALLMMGGVVAGPLYDAGYFRELLIAGNFFVVLGMFMTSLCTEYYQVVLAQGVCVGIGQAVMFLPSAAVVSQWFAKRRAIALGVQSAGSPIAGIVFPIIFGRLQPRIGFGWATRVIAFILLVLSVIPVIFMRTRLPSSTQKRAFLDKSVATDVPFLFFVAAVFFAFIGLYVPFFYVQLYAIEFGISSRNFSPYFVTILNAGSVLGRLIPNYAADYLGSMNVLILTTFLAAVLAFAWTGIKNFAGLIVFSILYGAFSGGVVGITPSAIVPLCPDMTKLGTRMGMCFFFAGISVLVGTPIGGAILAKGGESAWKGIIAYSGATLLAGAGLFLASLISHRKRAQKAGNS